ncbi:MAG TPA: response regulator [Pseudoxanthomonas sp.]|nr:response regulator [Pseudoxanthomonas sp.]
MSAAQTHVLFVDDDLLLRDVVAEALELAGFQVTVASGGAEALRVLQGDRPVDVIFSDVVMPNGVSGVELAQQAAVLRPGIRVVLASGHPRSQLPPFPENVAFIAKPYRVAELVDKIVQLGGEAERA